MTDRVGTGGDGADIDMEAWDEVAARHRTRQVGKTAAAKAFIAAAGTDPGNEAGWVDAGYVTEDGLDAPDSAPDEHVEVFAALAGKSVSIPVDEAHGDGLLDWMNGQPVTVTERWPRVRRISGILVLCEACRAPMIAPLPKGWTVQVENPLALGLPTRITPHRGDCTAERR